MRATTFSLFALFLISLLSVGCGDDEGGGNQGGGSGSDSAAAERPMSGNSQSAEPGAESSTGRQDFVAEAKAVCKRASRQIFDELTTASRELDLSQTQNVAKVARTIIVPGLRKESEEIRALGAPQGEEQAFEAYLDAMARIANRAENKPQQFSDEGSDQYKAGERAARDLGITGCPISVIAEEAPGDGAQ